MIKLIKVINLDRRPDRLKDFINQFTNSNLNTLTCERFSAIDGVNLIKDITNKKIENDPIFQALKNIDDPIPRGELGCLLSHYFVLKEIENNTNLNDDDLVLIFEDDVFFTDYNDEKFFDHINTFHKINKFDFIFLSGRWKKHFIPKNMTFFERSTKHIFKRISGNGYDWDRCAPAYLCTKHGAHQMIQRILEQFNAYKKWNAIDNIYTKSTSELITYDFFPHIYYLKPDYQTDIQGIHLQNKIFANNI